MKSIGIKLADGSFYPVMEDGKADSKTLSLTTVKDNQTTVKVDLYQSETGTMEDAEYLDTLQIEDLNPHPNGEPDFNLSLSLDDDNNLSAKVADPETNKASTKDVPFIKRSEAERAEPAQISSASAAVDDTVEDGLDVDDGLVSDTPVEETPTDDFNIDDFNLDEPSIEDTPTEAVEDAVTDGLDVTDGLVSDTPADDFNVDDFNLDEPVTDAVDYSVSDTPAEAVNDSLAVDDGVSDTPVEETPAEAVADNDTNTDTDSFDFNTDDLDSDFSFPDNEDTKAVDDGLAVADTVNDGLVSDTPVEETTADDFNINDFNLDEPVTDTVEDGLAVDDGIAVNDSVSDTPADDFNVDDFNLDEPSIEDTPAESGNDVDDTDAIGGISVTDETPESEINNFMEDKDTKDFDTSLTDGVLSPTDSSLPDFDTDDFGEKDEFSDTADGIDMTDDAISDFSTNDLDSNNLDSNSDAVVVSDSGLDLSDLDNDDAFSVPDFDNLNTSSSSTGAFNFDSDFDDPAFALPTASAASAAYNSPNLTDFDTDFNTNTSSSTTSDYSEKKKGGNAAVVVCIICAIICLLATALGLFVLPSRVNLLNMLWNQDEAQTQQNATEQTQSVQETEKVAPVAKENEIIIAPPEVEMIPEKPIEMTLDSEEVGEDGEKKEVEGIRYQIRWGDTLWDIADTYYRNPWLYPRIAKYNNITDPDFIVSGTYITIPK